jgi:hypothetical protein
VRRVDIVVRVCGETVGDCLDEEREEKEMGICVWM